MRVTFVLPDADLSGGVRVIAIHAEALKARGHDVFVVSTPPRPRGSWRYRLKTWLRPPAPTASHLDGLDVESRVIERWRPVRDADVPDADVVVATWWETAEWVAGLSPDKGVKAHFIQGYEAYGAQPTDRVRAVWRYPFQKIVVSKWLQDLAREDFEDSTATLAPNGVDLDLFHAPPREKRDALRVGFVYSTVQHKGCRTILDSIVRARAECPGLEVLAFGVEEPGAALPLPKGTDFHLRPGQERLRELYASCDVWLFGSRREGFGLPVLEAMACRTPVVATRAGAAPELVTADAGVLVEPDDAAAMGRAIVEFEELHPEQWKSRSQAAYDRARRHTWKRATDLFEGGLRLATERGRRGEIAGGAE